MCMSSIINPMKRKKIQCICSECYVVLFVVCCFKLFYTHWIISCPDKFFCGCQFCIFIIYKAFTYCRYGIPDEYSSVFRSALTKLVPRYCRNKTIWLPSDTAMVPPPLLVKHGVSLCHTVQEPGQFILVFPRAFTSSICTGYLVSESVYYAQPGWLNTAEQVFRVSIVLEQIRCAFCVS